MTENKTNAFEDIDEIEEEDEALPEIMDEDGNIYSLRITMKKIEQIEKQTGNGIFQLVQMSGGMLPIWVSRLFFQSCLYNQNSKAVTGKKADGVMNTYMRENSYPYVSAHIIKALDRDVPFLFRKD